MTTIKKTILYWQCWVYKSYYNVTCWKTLNIHYVISFLSNIFYEKNHGFIYRSLLEVTDCNDRIWKQNGNEVKVELYC